MNHETKPSVLVVDDTPENLTLLHKFLAQAGYDVRTLPHGALVSRSVRSAPPDLILLDIMMPDMDGYKVCAQLKADPSTRDIPVIFISALQENFDKLRAFAEGGVDYITKPFHAEEVLARVHAHARLHALQQDLESRNRELAAAKHDLELRNQELTAAKDKADAANRAKSTFLANMSHELRTPLNAVLGFAQLLERDRSLGERPHRYVETILSGGKFLLELLNDVLDLAKIEAGRFECFPEAWDTQSFFAELSEVFRSRAEQKDLFFHYEEATPLPRELNSDPRRLRQIAMNLIGNAVKFTCRGGITLRTGFADDKLVLEVIDTGPGIPADMLEKIFEPFQQAGDSAQKIQGTGLGLSITRKLAEMMGGMISVTSVEGQGSTFRVEIEAQALTTPAEQQAQAGISLQAVGYRRTDGGSGPLCILICDDIPDNLEMLVLTSQSLGFETLSARNGKECVEIAQSRKPDAVLLDLFMPKQDGFETTRALRALPGFEETPIVAVTAKAFAEAREQSLAFGCNAHITKPIVLAELEQTLGGLLPLEWEHAAASPAKIQLDENELQKLPPLLRAQLLTAVSHGDIQTVMVLARQLEQDECCRALSIRISELAERVELSALERLLNA